MSYDEFAGMLLVVWTVVLCVLVWFRVPALVIVVATLIGLAVWVVDEEIYRRFFK